MLIVSALIMVLRFTDKREITDVSQLSSTQKEQLKKIGKANSSKSYNSKAHHKESYKYGNDPSVSSICHHYKVMQGNFHQYDAWLYDNGNGMFFIANTTHIIGNIIQFDPDVYDEGLCNQLGMAMVNASLYPKTGSKYKMFKKMMNTNN